MKAYSTSIKNFFVLLVIVLFCACGQQEMTLTAKLSLHNNCSETIKPDSLEVIMRFIDKDGKPVIDADVVKLIPSSDSVMKLNLTLRKTDKWMVKKVLTKYGSPFCNGCLSDTIYKCKESGSTQEFVPVDSVSTITINCHCDYF